MTARLRVAWLAPEDLVIGVFHALVLAVLLLGGRHLEGFGLLLAWHLAVPALWFGVAFGTRAAPPLTALLARGWLFAWTMGVTFSSLGLMVGRVFRPDRAGALDLGPWLRTADRAVFAGHEPLVLLEPCVRPLLTDLMQLCYFSYYFLPLAPLAVLAWGRRTGELHRMLVAIVLGLYASYVGYFVAPAVGPFLTPSCTEGLASGARPPGWLLGRFIWEFVDTAETIKHDCMPSGHTAVTLIALVFAWRHTPRTFRVILPFGVGLIASTVYLRFHYVVDVVAGAALAAAVVPLAGAWVRWWEAWRSATASAPATVPAVDSGSGA